MGSSRLAWVGTFVIGGLLLFAVGLFMIGDRRLLFTERFLVRMRVREDLRPLVRTDSVAAVLADGLLGSVFIQIQSGSAEAPTVGDGDRIRGVDAVEIADLIEEGRETLQTVANEFLALRADMSAALEDVTAPIEGATQLISQVGEDVAAIHAANARVLNEAEATLASTQALVAALSSGDNTLGQLLGDDALYEGLVGTVRQTEATMNSVRRSAERVERAVERVSGPDSDTARLLTDAAEAAALARNAMEDVAENTEALKRSWPFSGFFADRGFYNLDQLTRDEYRGLFRDERYTPLRIWVEGDLLFETGGDDRVTLADGAVARLDEAMAGLLDYPRDSPIVVEGYAAGGGRRSRVPTIAGARRPRALVPRPRLPPRRLANRRHAHGGYGRRQPER